MIGAHRSTNAVSIMASRSRSAHVTASAQNERAVAVEQLAALEEAVRAGARCAVVEARRFAHGSHIGRLGRLDGERGESV